MLWGPPEGTCGDSGDKDLEAGEFRKRWAGSWPGGFNREVAAGSLGWALLGASGNHGETRGILLLWGKTCVCAACSCPHPGGGGCSGDTDFEPRTRMGGE